jgi:2'-5' RNA ligase
MKRRVFIAVKASQKLQERIVQWQREHNLPVRWISAENLHVTLVPPWYEEDIEAVKKSLQRLQKHRRFTVHFSTISFGPPKRPRLVWLTGESTDILKLQEHVESTLGAHHERQFRMHITIARFRAEDFRSFPTKRINDQMDWMEEIVSVVLMESKLSLSGAEYEVLEEIRLEG